MKKIKLSLIIAMLLFTVANISPLQSSAQAAVNFQVFYDGLSPYGNWVNYPGYGYAWVPNAGADFRPYDTNGHWVYSDEGWVWASDYPWGWAAFHYGTWVDDASYGWMWIPGYDWAPAWVQWGSINGYYGWAPLAPGFSIGVGYYAPINRWCFVDPRYMTSGNWGNHLYVAHGGRIAIDGGVTINNVRRISVVNNTSNYGGHGYFAGPKREDFQRVAHTTVTPVSIRASDREGKTQVGGNAISIYKPTIKKGTKVYSRPAKAAPAPARNTTTAHSNNRAPQRQQTVQHSAPQQRTQQAPRQQARPAMQQRSAAPRQAAPRQAAPRAEEHNEGGRR